ncbi:hypothetical protein JTB14_024430 [Gonioctena quinquepunctata]|nr:hypothetical protein JTB14_024430 [Gonioctena quinquepunctata]
MINDHQSSLKIIFRGLLRNIHNNKTATSCSLASNAFRISDSIAIKASMLELFRQHPTWSFDKNELDSSTQISLTFIISSVEDVNGPISFWVEEMPLPLGTGIVMATI